MADPRSPIEKYIDKFWETKIEKQAKKLTTLQKD